MYQVFISYKDADRALADQVARGLEADGYVTWYYDRDSRVGFNYMEYCGELIAECQAMVLLISPRSVASTQVTREVIRASEENKRILPVLCGLSYAQFQEAAPAWRQALAGIAAIELPAAGLPAILPRLSQALQNMGIGRAKAAQAKPSEKTLRVMLAYKRNAQPDEELLAFLERELPAHGITLFIDRHLRLGMEWAREIEEQIRASDVVIPLLSPASIHSEMLALEVEIAKDAALENGGKPRFVPVRVNLEGSLPESLGPILDPIQYALWK